MSSKTLYFVTVIDFPGNNWPVGDLITLNQFDGYTKRMYGRKAGRFWYENELRKYPKIYKELSEDQVELIRTYKTT